MPDTAVRFDKNFILLLPWKDYVINIVNNDGLSTEEIINKAEIINIANTY